MKRQKLANDDMMTPTEILDRLKIEYPEEYKAAYENAKNIIKLMDLASSELKENSLGEVCYWMLLAEVSDIVIKKIQKHGVVEGY